MSARIVRLCPPRDALEASVRALAADKQGRCFLQWLLYQCNVCGDVFVAGQRACSFSARRRQACGNGLVTYLYVRARAFVLAFLAETKKFRRPPKIVEIEEEIHG